MIQASLRVRCGEDFYRREDEIFVAEPLVGDGISFGTADDSLVLAISARVHMTQGDDATDIALEATVAGHTGDDPAFALLGHGFTKEAT